MLKKKAVALVVVIGGILFYALSVGLAPDAAQRFHGMSLVIGCIVTAIIYSLWASRRATHSNKERRR